MTADLSIDEREVATREKGADDVSRFHLEPGERWYVATTSPRKERFAAAHLANQNICSFLPLQAVTRRHARKTRTKFEPVFPRYLFIGLDVDRQRWRSVNGTLGIQHLLTDGKRPLAVAPGVVETLIQSSDPRGALVYKTRDLAVGARVELLAGAFAGALGVLHRLDDRGRIQVLLELLGGLVKVTVDREMVAAPR